MFDESVSTVYSSIWASMNSWFTPTVLFVLLNVMIGTIVFTSSLANQKQNHPKQQQQQQEDYSQSRQQQQQQQQEDYSQSRQQQQHQQEDYSQSQQQQQHQQEDYSQSRQQQQQPPKLARSPSLIQRIKSINFYNYRSQEPVKDYNVDQPHQQETPFEPPTHYIFEPAPEHTTIESETTQYIFNKSRQENDQTAQTQYDLQQIQYLFQHTHEQKLGNMKQDFHFEESLPEKSTQYTFQHTHEQKHEDIDTHFEFQKIHDKNEDGEEEGDLKSLDEVYKQLREHRVSRNRSDTKPSAGEAQAKLLTKMKQSASMKSPFVHLEEEDIVEARRPATTKERNSKTSDGDNEVDAKADDFINKFKQQLKLQRLDSILSYKEMIGRGS